MLKYLRQLINRSVLVLGLLAAWAGLSGCQSQQAASHPSPAADQAATAAPTPAPPTGLVAGQTPSATSTPAVVAPTPDTSPSMLLREGDNVKITFPGAPSLDTQQTIRRDGKITLDMVGEVKAAGLTPHEMELQLLKVYDSQLVVKEVSVTVQMSAFTIYVTGAVMRPGRVVSDRVETPLEAVIEAGLDQNRANLKKVKVIRENDNGQTEEFMLNLYDVLHGKPTKPFTLKPMDKIYVPEKFSWF
jgi:polysaccharide export outer membrane protein